MTGISDVMLGARAGTVARTWLLMLSLTNERSGSSRTVFFNASWKAFV